MKTRTRRLIVALSVLAVLLAFGVAVFLRSRGAPEAARLLPDGDAVIYVNLKNIRRLTAFTNEPEPQHDPDYQQFINETGFEFERDLDVAAFTVHFTGPNNEKRYSEIFIGRYDGARMSAYLHKLAKSVERYRQFDIYDIPVENRTVRVALLGIDEAAVSNMDDPAVIHGMIDRYLKLALPFGGPSLVREYYRRVPFGSLVWGIARIPASPKDPRQARSMTLPGGIDIFVPSESVMVASMRFLGAIHARAEFITQSEADAKQFTNQAGTFLVLFRSIEASAQLSGSDPDVKAVFDSLKVEQDKNKSVLSATIPLGFLKKLFSEPPTSLAPQSEPATPAPAQKAKPKPPAKTKKR